MFLTIELNFDIQTVVELISSISAFICGLFVIYLALFRVRNATVNVFAQMIVMNAGVDTLYGLMNIITLPVKKNYIILTVFQKFYSIAGCVFMVPSNPLLPQEQYVGWITVVTQNLVIYEAIVIIPIQFLFRYKILNGKPYNTWGLTRVCCISSKLIIMNYFEL